MPEENEKQVYFQKIDAHCKNILSNKYVLAWILQGSLNEYADFEIPVIVNQLIEGDILVSKVPVDAENDSNQKIIGLNTEITDEKEGATRFDLYFSCLLFPGADDSLLIDVEAQSNYRPGYPIINRGIFYNSREICMQKNTIFFNSNYKDLKKAVSIWVCIEPDAIAAGTVTRFSLQPEYLVGKFSPEKNIYDKMNVVLIHLPLHMDIDRAKADMLSLLYLLLSQKFTAEQIYYYLRHKYHFPPMPEFEREVSNMCSYAEGMYAKFRDEERNIGKTEGIEIGKVEGIQQEKLSTVRKLYQLGLPLSLIVEATGLSLETINITLGLNS
jgi:predicted transposase/invertase (TIGR01784 family)